MVIGAGAVGGIVAGLLTRAGNSVTLITKYPELSRIFSEDGILISGFKGTHTVKVPTVSKVTELSKRPEIVIIATKAPDMPEVATQIKPLLSDECLVVSMQNGIVEEELAGIIGRERTVGCVVGWGATMHSRGVVEMSSGGEFVIGYLDRPPDESLEQLAKLLSAILPVDVTDKILPALYSKLIINSCITTVGAICGLTLGEMLYTSFYRRLFLGIIREAVEVADAMELEIPPYAGRLNYYKLLKASKVYQHLYLGLFGFKYRRLKSSSLQSLERNKPTEVDYFNGFIVEKGDVHGIDTPVNRQLVERIKEIEQGQRKISPSNFEDFQL